MTLITLIFEVGETWTFARNCAIDVDIGHRTRHVVVIHTVSSSKPVMRKEGTIIGIFALLLLTTVSVIT